MSGRWSTPRWFTVIFAFLLVSAAYLFAFPQPNVFYAVVVLLHAVFGMVALVWLAILFYRLFGQSSAISRTGWLLLLAGAIIGAVLIKTGTPRSDWNWLYAHIILSFAGVGILLAERTGKSEGFARLTRVGVCLLIIAAIGTGAWYLRTSRWQQHARIKNPIMP